VDQILPDLTPRQRAELLRDLQALMACEVRPSQRVQTARQWFALFLSLCCFGLIPWTIGLSLTLPRHYVAGNWGIAWTGFDVILLSFLSITAWALWKQYQIVVPASIVTSILLVCDAWFDILTANGRSDLVVSIALAFAAELPLAILLGLLGVRLLYASVRVARGLEPTARVEPLWRAPLLTSVLPDQRTFQQHPVNIRSGVKSS
jgi:hypothetical protein